MLAIVAQVAEVGVVGVGCRDVFKHFAISFHCPSMVCPRAYGVPSGLLMLNVSVLSHLDHELVYFLLSAFVYYISGEVSLFDKFLYYMVSCCVVPFRPGSSCSAKV